MEKKFRVWVKPEKIALFVDGIFNDPPYIDMSAFFQYESITKKHEVDVMQYTGLLDKNGKEIYEGDLIDGWIKDEKFIAKEVIFDGGAFSVMPYGKESKYTPCLYEVDDAEVVGNIYESPELLEEK
jgi:uncharacterized phage protein (TIGR01671 family)